MNPLLDRDKTRPVQSLALVLNDCCVQCLFALRVFGAILVPGKIPAATEVEAVDNPVNKKFGPDDFDNFS
jgi:hypothetical protein